MQVGVSTACLYPENVEIALAELAKRNVKLIEIFINTHCEMKKEFVLEMKKVIEDNGIKVSSIHPFTCGIEPMMFFTHYERRFLDILEYYKNFFETMNMLGADVFVFHGNKKQNSYPNKLYFERYAGLRKVGKEFGITVAQENVSRCESGKLSFLKKMSKYLGDEVSFILDTKQAYRAGEDAFSILEELKNKIVNIHFSEYGPAGDCLPYGEGFFDSNAFLKKLSSMGFKGSVILELYRDSYVDYDSLADNYKKLSSAVRALTE